VCSRVLVHSGVAKPPLPGVWACWTCRASTILLADLRVRARTHTRAGGTHSPLVGRGRPGGALFMYGPFKIDGEHTAQSNEEFDMRLREQNPSWGVRDSTELAQLSAVHGLVLEQRVPMPSNNFILILRRQ